MRQVGVEQMTLGGKEGPGSCTCPHCGRLEGMDSTQPRTLFQPSSEEEWELREGSREWAQEYPSH
jgi:hypothetical protein